MTGLVSDLRYALRSLRKTPGVTTVAVLTLALAMGATTGIYTVIDRALLRALPAEDPGRLVHIVTDRDNAGTNFNLSYPAYVDFRDRADVFAGVVAHTSVEVALRTDASAERVDGAAVTANLFDVLGLRPFMGRWFLAEEDRVASPLPVVVLSHGLWQRRFGADREIVGTTILLNQRPFTVVGVAPAAFAGLVRAGREELWLPLSSIGEIGEETFFDSRRSSGLNVFARLAAGVSREQAQAAMTILDAQLVAEGLKSETEHSRLLDGSRGLTYRVSSFGRWLGLLVVAVVIVLLVACANVANLLLVKAAARPREIAVRLAVGASRHRIVRQLLIESLVLAILGGAAGLLVAGWTADLLLRFQPTFGGPLALDVGIDWRVLGFAGLLMLGTTLVFGLTPSARVSRPDLVPVLKQDAGSSGLWERRFGLRALVTMQVALSLVLLVGTGLFVQTVRNLQRIDPGFNADGVLLASLEFQRRDSDLSRAAAFYDALLPRVSNLPGVISASFANTVTPNPAGFRIGALPEGYTPADDEGLSFDVNVVGPGYFETLRVPLLSGRGFDERDRLSAPLVAVINETVAQRYWQGQSPIGQHIYIGPDRTRSVEVVGVAADGKYRDLREPPVNNVYFPAFQSDRLATRPMTLLVRTSAPLDVLAPALRDAVAEIDPNVPLFDVRTLEDHVRTASSLERMVSALLTSFGLLALLLAVVGIYGALSFVVNRQTREIGVRVAIGASVDDVVRHYVRWGVQLVASGTAIGVLIAIGLSRLARGLLYGVDPADPWTISAAIGVLVTTALLAAYVPARRAAKVDPVVALRYE